MRSFCVKTGGSPAEAGGATNSGDRSSHCPTRSDGQPVTTALPAAGALQHSARLPRLGFQFRQSDLQTLNAFRGYRQRHLARSQYLPIPGNRPAQHFVIGMAEQVPALHLNHQRRGADPRKGEELLRALRLEQRRVRRAIGEDQPLRQNCRSFGLSPKSPPYAQNALPFSSFFVNA